MYLQVEQDEQEIRRLVDMIADLFVEVEASNQDVLTAVLFISVNVCDAMEMNRSVYLLNCENMYDCHSRFSRGSEGEVLQ